ncbi:hypothetical protein FJ250_09790, partial [bacterium]|nr:hypothetical protein [bacterium]
MSLSRTAAGARGAVGEGGQARSPQSFLRAIRRYPEAPLFMYGVFLAFVLARYVQANFRSGLLEAMRFEFLLGAASCGLAVMYIAGNPRQLAGARGLVAAIALLFFVALTQLQFAADPATARLIFNDRVFKFAMLTFLT